jgi:hypothetical protein
MFRLADEFGKMFKEDNPNYNHSKFREAVAKAASERVEL